VPSLGPYECSQPDTVPPGEPFPWGVAVRACLATPRLTGAGIEFPLDECSQVC
jgi:hypothetical protein